jgi:hypothetical protein
MSIFSIIKCLLSHDVLAAGYINLRFYHYLGQVHPAVKMNTRNGTIRHTHPLLLGGCGKYCEQMLLAKAIILVIPQVATTRVGGRGSNIIIIICWILLGCAGP